MSGGQPLFSSKPKSLFGDKPVTTERKPLFGTAVVRKRIEVSDSDLQVYHKDIKVIAVAKQIILTTNLDNLCYDTVLEWGGHVQKQHGDYLEKLLSDLNSPVVTVPRTCLNSVLGALNELKPSVIFKKNWLGNDKTDEFALRYENLKKQVDSLKNSVTGLKAFRQDIEKLQQNFLKIEKELEPFIVSASFFSNYKKDNFPLELFVSRLSSLITTQTTLQQNRQTGDILQSNILNLLDAIQNVILTEIPLWITTYTTVLTTKDKSQIDSLEQQQTQLYNKLKNV